MEFQVGPRPEGRERKYDAKYSALYRALLALSANEAVVVRGVTRAMASTMRTCARNYFRRHGPEVQVVMRRDGDVLSLWLDSPRVPVELAQPEPELAGAVQ